MHWLSVLVFSLSANIDNFTVGIAYGIKKIRIGWGSNLLIAVVTSLGTGVSMLLGAEISRFLPQAAANAIGSVILMALGAWMIRDAVRDRRPKLPAKPEGDLTRMLREPETADRDHSGTVTFRESLLLALALTLNNFGLGIGASITGLPIGWTVAGSFVCSLLSIPIGCRLGESWLSRAAGQYASLFAGAMILLLGTYELLV